MTNRDSLKNIKENFKCLDSCQKHKFDLRIKNIITDWILKREFTCINCGGKLLKKCVIYYVKGYIHAGKNPEDILIEGFPFN